MATLPVCAAAFPTNDIVSLIIDVLAFGLNTSLCVFAFLSNLLVIITTGQHAEPSKASQHLASCFYCSLSAADCLTGVTTQPLFFIWRLMLRCRARRSCYLKTELFQSRYEFNTLALGCSFDILTLISFDTYQLQPSRVSCTYL